MGGMDDLIYVSPRPPPSQEEQRRAKEQRDLQEHELAHFFALQDCGWTFEYEHGSRKQQDFFPAQHDLLAWGSTTTDISEKFVLRRLHLILVELRELRRDVKESSSPPPQQRPDYSFHLGCACLGVLVLLLFK
jgi:hypothetical protein